MFSSFAVRTITGRANTGPTGGRSASLSVGGPRGSANGKQREGGRVSSVVTSTRSSKASGNVRPTMAESSVGSKRRCFSDSEDELQPVSASLSQSRNGGNNPSVAGSTTLEPSRIQQMKKITQKMAEDGGVPIEKLKPFIELGDIFLMLVDIKVSLLCLVPDDETEASAAKSLINSKDFSSFLKSRLFACLLSPNLTAYLTDANPHIMEFIQQHMDVFKVTKIMFEDPEVHAFLGKMVARLLTTIRGQIKSRLVKSLFRRSSIMDVLQRLTRSSCSHIDIDASHWHRAAFLRTCLRVFLMNLHDFRDHALTDLYSPSIIDFMRPTLRIYVSGRFGFDIEAVNNNVDNADTDESPDFQGMPVEGADDEPHMSDDDAEGISDDEHSAEVNNDAGFQEGLAADGGSDEEDNFHYTPEGSESPINFRPKDYWKYADACLDAVRRRAHKASSNKDEYQIVYASIFVQYLQADLCDFPGRKKVLKLLKSDVQDVIAATDTNSTSWQNTIQSQLVW